MTVYMTLRQQPVAGGVKNPSFLEVTAGATIQVRELSEQDFVARAAGRDILFATHGFNVNFQDGARSLGRLEEMLQLPPSAFYVAVLWPGDFWIPAVNYPFEGADAKDSGRRLAAFCNRRLGAARSISFVTHSLGARLALEAVKNLDRKARAVCLTAAAVDDDCLNRRISDGVRECRRHFVTRLSQGSCAAAGLSRRRSDRRPPQSWPKPVSPRAWPQGTAAAYRGDGAAMANSGQRGLQSRRLFASEWS